MNIFETLLEIKTGLKNLSIKAIYVKDLQKGWKWNYYIYYYDVENYTLYINGLEFDKINPIILEKIINKVYKQEQSKIKINTFVDIIKQMQMNKKPKVFCLQKSKDTQFICINKIDLKAIRNSRLEIKELKVLDK